MKRASARVSLLLVTVLAANSLSALAQTSLSNADVLKMVQAGLGEAVIVQTIKTAPATNFDLSADSLVALKTAGVSDAILSAMIAGRNTSAGVAETTAPTTVTVPDGTELKLRLLTPVSSSTARLEDPIRFEAVDDVKVIDAVVIRKGAEAKGHVSEVKKNGSFGRSGKLSFSIDSVAGVDGNAIAIRSSKDLKGDARVGATVAAVALVGVFGGFVKGKNIDAPAGGEYTVFTNGAREVRVASR
jgi:hypothetical protein